MSTIETIRLRLDLAIPQHPLEHSIYQLNCPSQYPWMKTKKERRKKKNNQKEVDREKGHARVDDAS